jgi:uncharacterized protein (TIGR00266 family)
MGPKLSVSVRVAEFFMPLGVAARVDCRKRAGLGDFNQVAAIPRLLAKIFGATAMTYQPPGFGRKQTGTPASNNPAAVPSGGAPAATPVPLAAAEEPQMSKDELEAAYQRFLASEQNRRSGNAAAEADLNYKIQGADLQLVEIELAPGQGVIAEAGAMIWKHSDIDMKTILGDGSDPNAGLMDKVIGAGKRVLTGESLCMTEFAHGGFSGNASIAFGAPTPGCILSVNLSEYGGALVCQKDSFLAASRGTKVGIHFQKRIMAGLFGGEGFIMQRLEGNGQAFVQMGGTLVKRELQRGERIHVDTGCVAAFTPDVDFNLVAVGGIANPLFGGEGMFYAALTGPGIAWIQSMPFARLAARIAAINMGHGSENRGQGSILGGFLQGGN